MPLLLPRGKIVGPDDLSLSLVYSALLKEAVNPMGPRGKVKAAARKAAAVISKELDLNYVFGKDVAYEYREEPDRRDPEDNRTRHQVGLT